MYAGGCAPCARDAGGYASSAALYVGGRELCLLEVPEVMRCVLFGILEAAESGICLLEGLEVLEVIRLCAVLYAGGRG